MIHSVPFHRTAAWLLAACLFLLSACGRSYRIDGESVRISCQGKSVRIQVLDEKILRITEVPGRDFPERESLVIVPQEAHTDFRVSSSPEGVRITTRELSVLVAKDGTLSFYDAQGRLRLGGNRVAFTPIRVEGADFYSTEISFDTAEDEALYGLGQHQSGEFNRKGTNEELFQYNTKISVPFIASTRGYALLFDAYSLSRWGNPAPYQQLGTVFRLFDKDGVEGALTGTYIPAEGHPLIRREDSLFFENEWAIRNLPDLPLQGAKVLYEGYLEAREAASYHFIQYYAGFQQTELGGETRMSRRWRPAWNPNSYKFTRDFSAGERVPIRIEWEPDGDVSYIGLRVALPRSSEEQQRLSFWSECEPALDYYYIAGDSYDELIHGYRQLSGKAPVMPRWALGFWQSRERYATQADLVSTLEELRQRHIPVDNIVQDWQYWEDDAWGSHAFDASRYPDPEKMLDDVHALHGRFMISVWPKFYTRTEHYRQLKDAGYAYTHAEEDSLRDWLGHCQSFYDAYAAGGRRLFWQQMDESLYSRYGRKIDAWWMDASEPNLRDCLPLDYMKWLTTPTALGPSTEYLNAYALVNAQAIYEGQRSVDPDKRVFLLTRNGFAGLQRYSTASWSGDIGTSWTDMRMQMAAGLGYSMSGIPFWGMDIGGFSVMSKFYDAAAQDEWQELQTRWHQFGTFVPLFRTHGQWPRRELWNIAESGSPAYESILSYMRLRYRLMPYLYSLAGAVYWEDATILRGLVMDFPEDPEVRELTDQWLLGPALMPCPVSEYGARARSVYFPAGGWYDFYTGEYLPGAQRRDVPAPYERIPLYVRAGSILPFGPAIEWSDQQAADPIRLYIYTGRDASFRLYEDENTNYQYEKGAYSCIPIQWDENARQLLIGEREGTFPGMLETREFIVVRVDPTHPQPYDPEADGIRLDYRGEALSLSL